MAALTFPEMSKPAAMTGRDGPKFVSTSNKDFDNELLPNMPRQRNQR